MHNVTTNAQLNMCNILLHCAAATHDGGTNRAHLENDTPSTSTSTHPANRISTSANWNWPFELTQVEFVCIVVNVSYLITYTWLHQSIWIVVAMAEQIQVDLQCPTFFCHSIASIPHQNHSHITNTHSHWKIAALLAPHYQ